MGMYACLSFCLCKWKVAFACLSIIIKKKKKERTPTVLALYLFFFFLRGKNESYKNAPKQRLFFLWFHYRDFFFVF